MVMKSQRSYFVRLIMQVDEMKKKMSEFNNAFGDCRKQALHIAQLQNLCKRTLDILETEGFFDKTSTKDGWHASLFNDLKKSADGQELKTFDKMMNLAADVMEELQK